MSCRGLFVGLATLDLVQRVDHPPGVDEKLVARRSDLAAGGPATAAAVTFRGLGGHGVLLSALGTGPVAGLVAGDLDRAGVSVVDAWAGGGDPAGGDPGGADIGISAITVLEGTGERSVVSRNAAGIGAAVPAGLSALVRTCDVVLADGHHPVLAVAAARAARQAGVPLVLDCGSAKPVYAELLTSADAAVCSAGFTLDGRAGFDAVADGLLAAGARMAAMTDGAGPVRWRTRETEGSVEVPAVPVRDTLGAGDVLHGAVAFAVACGVTEPERSLRFGVEVAALRVQHTGPRGWLGAARLGELAAELRR